MASSAELTVRTPFTLVETSTPDNTWNTSVTLSASTNYKEYKTVEGRTATAKKNCMNKTVNCTASWGLPRVRERRGCLLCRWFEGQFTYRRKEFVFVLYLGVVSQTNMTLTNEYAVVTSTSSMELILQRPSQIVAMR